MTLPLRNMLIGKFTDLFASYGSADGGVTGEHFMKELWGLFVLGCWMALGSWATTSLHTFLWMYTAEVQSRVRGLFCIFILLYLFYFIYFCVGSSTNLPSCRPE